MPLPCLAAGHGARGTLQQAYLEKNHLSALVAFAIAASWDQTSFMRRHFCGRALVRLCPQLATAISWQCQSVLFYLTSLCRFRCQTHGSTACSQGCAMCLGKSKLGMLGSSQESHKQTTRSLTGQLKASCRLLCTVASASGRTCLSGHRGESHPCAASQVRLCISLTVFSASL